METKISLPDLNKKSISQRTSPSFLDRFMRSIQRLPIPYWLTYLVLFFVQSAVFHVLAWNDGWLPNWTFDPMVFLFPLWLWGPMAIMTYLDRISVTALSRFHPLLEINEDELEHLKDEFTTMSNRSVILSGIFWTLVYAVLMKFNFPAINEQYGMENSATTILYMEGLVSYFFGSAIYYHSLRQLWLVNRTVKMVRKFNMFQLDPVYAFSSLTSHTGLSWMIMLGLTLLMFPLNLANGAIMITLILQIALALAAFFLPLQFVNHHLAGEKHRLIEDLNYRVETTLERMHNYIDESQFDGMESIEFTMTALNAEREILKNIPTWPWKTGTLTGFLSAIVLPVILFLIQLAIQKWMGG